MTEFEIMQEKIRKGYTEITWRHFGYEFRTTAPVKGYIQTYTIEKIFFLYSYEDPRLFINSGHERLDDFFLNKGIIPDIFNYNKIKMPKDKKFNFDNVTFYVQKYLDDFLLEEALLIDKGEKVPQTLTVQSENTYESF